MVDSRAPLGRCVVVAGGSLAGMLAARALSGYFERVVVYERDELQATPAPRRTTPQSHHVHVLLKGGENAINRLIPGFRSDIEAGGSVTMRAGKDFFSASELGVAPRQDGTLDLHGQSRWFLEHCVRQRVLATTPNVELRTNTTVRGLRYDAARSRVIGATVEASGNAADVDADLVVDATGRGEGAMRWLATLGLARPEVEEVIVDFGYASAVVELADDPVRDWKALAIGNLPRVGARGAVLLPIEGGHYICSQGGRAGDYPPEDKDGFIEFAKSLPNPTLYDALVNARFMTPVARMIYPANRFRHYEQLASMPEGLLPIGDALCSFNPTYGQGMSSAGLQAEALYDTFDARQPGDSIRELTRRHLLRAAEVARLPWRNANYNDFFYPTTKGNREMFTPEEMKYRMQVQIAAAKDAEVRRVSTEVSHLLIPFERLFDPEIRARVEAAQPRRTA
jgi:2-polyprenyl-6-methoxyphenol hydroxylase-like FAD-dependent oxidoreductase